jgi:hypothetical protein
MLKSAALFSALLASPAAGAGLRKAAETRALSATEVAAVQRLGAKYDCNMNAASLVTTLKQISIQNKAARIGLNTTCAHAQSGFTNDLVAALAAANATEATAPAEGAKVYAALEAPALAAYKSVLDEHSGKVAAAKEAEMDAKGKEVEALARRDEKQSARDTAATLFGDQVVALDEAASSQNGVLAVARASTIATAQAVLDDNVAAANSTRTASNKLCQAAYDDRMSLVTKDEAVIKKEIMPLLEQLKACGPSGSGSSESAAAASLLETSTDVEFKRCKKASRKLRALEASLLQTSSAERAITSKQDPNCVSCEFEAGKTWCWSVMGSPASCASSGITNTCDKKDGANVPAVTQRSDCPGTPAAGGHDSGSAGTGATPAPADQVTGNLGDWESRLAAESADSADVRTKCLAEATGIYYSAKRGFEHVFGDAKEGANRLFTASAATVATTTADKKAKLKLIAEATEEPAATAQAEYESAQAEARAATSSRNAAVDLEKFMVSEADTTKSVALAAARDAEKISVANVEKSAQVMRDNARDDQARKSREKTNECTTEYAALSDEHALVKQIEAKIATLTTIACGPCSRRSRGRRGRRRQV